MASVPRSIPLVRLPPIIGDDGDGKELVHSSVQQVSSGVGSEQPHSCIYCEELVLELPEDIGTRTSSEYAFDLSPAYVLAARKAGCCLFQALTKAELVNVAGMLTLEISITWSHGSNDIVFRLSSNETGPVGRIFRRACIPEGEQLLHPDNLTMWKRSAATTTAFETARGWLNDCYTPGNHDRCIHKSTYFLPSRLVEIQCDGNVTVRNTSDLKHISWCSLSYCWGGDQPIKTTRANFQCGKREICFSDLPKTMQDAVVVTTHMGISHLWVDALCIIQDDAEDVNKELSQMPQIYQNSHFTLVASRARNAEEGFLQPRLFAPFCRLPPFTLRFRTISGVSRALILLDYWSAVGGPEEPVDTRAWIFQEVLLSPRILVYGSTTLSWICLSRTHRDAGMKGPESRMISMARKFMKFLYTNSRYGTSIGKVVQLWHDVIVQYSRRALTNPNERLVALAAVAEFFGKTFDLTYLAGLWKEHLKHYLLWSYKESRGNCRPDPRTPSWSWASIESNERLHWGENAERVDVLHAEAKPVSSKVPFGAVACGSLRLRCELSPARIRITSARGQLRTWEISLRDIGPRNVYLFPDCIDHDLREDEVSSSSDCDITVWLMRTSEDSRGPINDPDPRPHGLILLPTAERIHTYRRIGTFIIDIRYTLKYLSFETQIITLV